MSTDDHTTGNSTTDGTTEPVPDDPIDLLCGAAWGCPVEVLNWYVHGLIAGVASAPPGSIWSQTKTAFPEMIANRLMGMGVSHERVVMVTCAATIAVDLAQAAREAFPPARDELLTSDD